MTIAEALMKAKTSPEMRKLTYPQQQQVVRQLIDKNLMTDPKFLLVPDADKPTVYGQLVTSAVKGWKPLLNSYTETPLTPEDTAALQQGIFADLPGTQDSYKRGMWILGRLQQGDQNAVPEAQGWIVRNSAATSSLLFQVAAGAKDAIETMFGKDKGFNSLALNSQDYQKMADAMYANMPSAQAQGTMIAQNLVGMGVSAAEMIGLNVLLIGGPGRAPMLAEKIPGLFTAKLWKSLETMKEAQTTARGITMWGSTIPNIVDAVVGGGITNIVASFPKLIETGTVQGPKKFTEQLASTFGQGVAFDFFFNVARSTYRYAVNPVKRALAKFDPLDPATFQALKDSAGNLDQGKFAQFLNDTMAGTYSKEWFDSMDPADQASWLDHLTKLKTLFNTPSFDVNTPDGFRVMAKAMGFDAAIDVPTGKVRVFGDNGLPWANFKNTTEAVSWFTKNNMDAFTHLANIDDVILGAQHSGRVRVFGKTDIPVKDLSQADLHTMIQGGLRGTNVDEETVSSSIRELYRRSLGEGTPEEFKTRGFQAPGKLNVQFVSEADFLQAAKLKPEVAPTGTETILVPKTLTRLDTKQKLIATLDPILSKLDPNAPKLSVGTAPLTIDSLNLAMGKIGGSVEQGGARGIRVKLPTGEVQDLSDLGSANAFVWRTLVDSGAVPEKDYATLFNRSTGFSLKHVTDDAGIDLWEVWAPGGKSGKGKLVFTANSVGDLMDWSKMDYRIQLPDYLVPDMMIRKGKLAVSQTVVTGPVSSMKKFLEDFGDPKVRKMRTGTSFRKTMANGQRLNITVQNGGKSIEVEWPTVGFAKKFDSVTEVKDFLGSIDNSFDALNVVAARKGLHVDMGPGGVLIFQNGTDAYSAKTLDEAHTILASIPDAYEGPELVQAVSPVFDEEFRKKIVAAVGNVETPSINAKSWVGQNRLLNTVEAWYRPATSYINDVADRYGKPELRKLFNETLLQRRHLGSILRPMTRTVETMLTDPSTGKVFKRSQLRMLGRFLDYAPEKWDALATNLGLELTDAQRNVLMNARTYLAKLGDEFQIDFLGFHENYLPHLRRFSRQQVADIINTRQGDVIEQLFGNKLDNMPALRFLSRNARQDAVLDMLGEGDLLRTLTYYTEKGYREKLLKPYADRMESLIRSYHADRSLPEEAQLTLSHWLINLLGGATDQSGVSLQNFSLEFTSSLSNKLGKVARIFGEENTPLGKYFKNLSEDVISTDVVGDLSQNITNATLGFRPIRALTNTAQYMNTYALYGPYAAHAPAKLTDGVLRDLFQRGILDDKIFASAGDDMAAITRKFNEIALKPHQATEYATRAWTAIASQDAFDDAAKRLAAGRIDLKGFVDVARIDWLPNGILTDVLDLVKKGSLEAARDQVATHAVRTLMFDYSKENWPELFQSLIGRLYGKFGVYPVGQIELYRTLASRGNWANRLDRTARLIAAAAAIKTSFAAVGIKYSGFNLTDPFTFSGGPLWSSLIDLSRATASGSEGQLARYKLERDWLPATYSQSKGLKLNIPRLLTPGGVQLTFMQKALKDAPAGDYFGTFLDLLGASRTTEPLDSVSLPW